MEKLILELTVIFFLSALTGIILSRFRIPSLIVYMLIGFIIGPHALGVISDTKVIHVLAEIGIVLLLFGIGIEFSIHKLLNLNRRVYIIGIGQILITAVLGILFSKLFGIATGPALFFGCIITLSSTAIVLKTLTSANDEDSTHGQIAIGMMILQDLAVVPMIILLPLLKNSGSEMLGALSLAGLKIAGFIIVIFIISKYFIRRFLHLAFASGSKELLLLSAISVSLGIAVISKQFGLSLALGAFFAGLLISESDYAHHLFTDLIPFRDAFSCLFFTSIGMWLEPKFLMNNFLLCFGLVSGVILLKFLIVLALSRLTRFTWHSSLMAGLTIAQTGEFSFILIQLGWGMKLFSESTFQLTIAVSSLSMLATPIIYHLSKHYFYKHLFGRTASRPEFTTNVCPMYHIIICGCGTVGMKVLKLLKSKNIQATIIGLNYARILELSREGISAIFGDATDKRVLEKANINCAKAVALTFADDDAQARAIKKIKELHPDIPVIGRLHHEKKRIILEKTGSASLVSEELEVADKLVDEVENYMKSHHPEQEDTPDIY